MRRFKKTNVRRKPLRKPTSAGRSAAIASRRAISRPSRKRKATGRTSRTKRQKIIVPPDTIRETVMATRGTKARCPGSTNIWTQSPDGTQITASSMRQNFQGFYLCDRNQLATALAATSDAPTNTAGNTADTKNIFWRRAKKEMTFTNSSNSPANITLFHFICKRDTSQSITLQWLSGSQDAQGTSTDNRQTYGASLFNNPVVPRYWKFKKTYDFTVAPGSTVKHTWIENMNRRLSNEVIANDVNPNTYLAGLTQVVVVLVKGYPATSSVNNSLVISAPVKVNILTADEYRYTFLTDNTSNLVVATGTGTGGVGDTALVYDQNGSATNSENAVGI